MSLWQSMKDPWHWNLPTPWDLDMATPIFDSVFTQVFGRHAVWA